MTYSYQAYITSHGEIVGLLPHDARSVERGIAIVNRPYVRLSVCLSVTLMYRGGIGWTSSKLITGIISLRYIGNVVQASKGTDNITIAIARHAHVCIVRLKKVWGISDGTDRMDVSFTDTVGDGTKKV